MQSTVTSEQDEDDLRYWVSSASLMRGVSHNSHGLKFLNQLDTMAYPPIWTLAAAHGHHIGVWGSSFSYDWKDFKSQKIDFYLPDKFSPDNFAKPRRTVAYQRILRLLSKFSDQGMDWTFNAFRIQLALTHFFLSRALRLQIGAIKAFFRNDGLALRFKPKVLVAARLAFYEFMSVYPKHIPALGTLTLGSLATAMHVSAGPYLESEGLPKKERIKKRAKTLLGQALHELDLVVADLMHLAKEENITLVFVSGYGQAAATLNADTATHADMWVLNDLDLLKQAIEFGHSAQQLPAMFPCTSVIFDTNNDRDDMVERLGRIYQPDSNAKLFHIETGDRTLSIKLMPSAIALTKKSIRIRSEDGVLISRPIEQIGLRQVRRRWLSGSHAPGGVLMVHGGGFKAANQRVQPVSESSIARFVCALLRIDPPEYMDTPPEWLEDKLRMLGLTSESSRVGSAQKNRAHFDFQSEMNKLRHRLMVKPKEMRSKLSPLERDNALLEVEKFR